MSVPFRVYGTAIVEIVADTRTTITVWGQTLTGVLNPHVLVCVVEPFHVYVLVTSRENVTAAAAINGIPVLKLVLAPTWIASESDQPDVSATDSEPLIELDCICVVLFSTVWRFSA